MTSATAPARFTYRAQDGLEITAYHWKPAGESRGVVQLTHGMGEHLLRYAPLAEALAERGFAVFGQDHRGHGASAASEAALGQVGADGWASLIADIGLLSAIAREEYPGLPLVLLAHSMGSFAVQQFLLDHSDRADAVAFTGTAALDLLEPALDLDAELDLAMFNAAFVPARTDYDWLSRDEAQVDAYIADPRCGFGLDTAAVKAMFTGARQLADPDRMARVRADLPLYVAVGDADPVNAQLALVNPLVDRYKAAGIDVTFKIYPGARHELFNETNRAEVVADLLAWFDRVLAP